MYDIQNLHPDMRGLIEARRHLPPASSPAEKRANWSRYAVATALPRPETVTAEDRTIPTDGVPVPVRIYRQADGQGLQPVIVYLHGGGFMMGDLDSSDSIAWGLCLQAGAAVVSVDYRLAPEHPYPAAFDDCYGVLVWLAVHGAEIGVDGLRIAICGDSAGGNLAAACALAALDRDGPRILAQAMVYPTVGCRTDLPSYDLFGEGPSLTRESMILFLRNYYSRDEDWTDPYAAPISARDVSRLSPTFVHSAEVDPLRDDGRAFASKLALAGVQVSYREAKAMLHGFLRMREAGPGGRAEFTALVDFLRSHLHPKA